MNGQLLINLFSNAIIIKDKGVDVMYNYYCIISKEEDFYIVDFPDFKGSRCSCFTFGETLTEAVEMAEDVLVTMLDGETSVPTRSSLKAILSHAKEGDSILNVTVNINDIS